MIKRIEQRITTIRQMLNQNKLKHMLIMSPQGILWVLGLRASTGRILVSSTGVLTVFFDGRYIEAAKQALPDVDIFDLAQFGPFCKAHEISAVACEREYVSLEQQEALAKIGLSTVSVSGQTLRIIKDESEVAKLQKAADITAAVFLVIRKWIKPGMTEREISRKISVLLLEMGAEGNSFEPIVASGTNGAFPHHRDSLRQVEDGDFITLDFGCIYEGYCSDMTRTILIGSTPNKNGATVAKYYEIVKQAQALGIKAARPGITGSEIDQICRDYIKSQGYDFAHGTGHGLGIDVHEQPYVSKANNTKLVAGNCITVEPGIYVPGIGGVRIEDDVMITSGDPLVLTRDAPK